MLDFFLLYLPRRGKSQRNAGSVVHGQGEIAGYKTGIRAPLAALLDPVQGMGPKESQGGRYPSDIVSARGVSRISFLYDGP